MRKIVGFRTIGRLVGLSMIIAFATLRFWDPVILEMTRGMIFDLYQNAYPREADDQPVTIVDIDEKSLKELGQWPWSRAVVAELVDRLAEGGAAAIGFDTLFAEPDRLSPPRLAGTLRLADEAVAASLRSLPDSDAVLARAIARTRVVLGQAGQPVPRDRGTGAETPQTSFATIGGDPSPYLIRFPGLLRNLPELEAAAAGRGLFTIRPERDGVIRRVPAILSTEDTIAPALAIDLLRVASGAPTLLVKSDQAGVKSVVVAGAEIATDRDGQLWLHFSPHDPRRYVSAIDVLRGTVPAERINGKLALVGTSAVGLFDLRSTPVERVMPGVEIHAQLIESILAGSLLNRPNYSIGAEIFLTIAIGLTIVIVLPMLGAFAALSLGALIALLLVVGSWYLFAAQQTLIDVAYPLASSFSVFLLLTFLNYFREEQRRAQIRSAFGQYLSPDLVEQLTREPDRLVLGGETREMSVLFSDVRGFTAIAEGFKTNPRGLTQLMNRLLTPLTYAIIERRGTIDKYIGDAIMAFWNAPLGDPDHALHACEAALEIVQRLERLNTQRRKEAERSGETVVDMQIGVGVSTGYCVVGNMGSDIRFDYSVLGDCVNLASRLEGLTAVYGLPILVASETARHCLDKLAVIEVDLVRVKGRQDVERIYSVLGGPDLARLDDFRAFRASFSDMLECYRTRDWREARRLLERSQRTFPSEQFVRLLDLYRGRLLALENSPPPADWDGVFHAIAKRGPGETPDDPAEPSAADRPPRPD